MSTRSELLNSNYIDNIYLKKGVYYGISMYCSSINVDILLYMLAMVLWKKEIIQMKSNV